MTFCRFVAKRSLGTISAAKVLKDPKKDVSREFSSTIDAKDLLKSIESPMT